MNEKRRRSLVKAVTYRALATIATFSIALAFTGNVELATSIGLVDTVVKFLLFYVNERIWLRSRWGYQSQATALQTVEQPASVQNTNHYESPLG